MIRRDRRPVFDSLEGRQMLSMVLGNGTNGEAGTLYVTAPKASGNTCIVSYDAPNHAIKVSMNGHSKEFSGVTKVFYSGGTGDVFKDISGQHLADDIDVGANSTIYGGNGWNMVTSWGASGDTVVAPADEYGTIIADFGTAWTVKGPGSADVIQF